MNILRLVRFQTGGLLRLVRSESQHAAVVEQDTRQSQKLLPLAGVQVQSLPAALDIQSITAERHGAKQGS